VEQVDQHAPSGRARWRLPGFPGAGPAAGAVGVVAVVAGFALLLVAAALGPVGMASSSGRVRVFEPPPTPPPTTDGGTPGRSLEETTRGVRQVIDLSWVGTLLAWLVILLVLGVVALGLLAAWRSRPRIDRGPAAVAFDVLPEARAAQAVRDEVDRQLASLREGDPRNAIVRCWARLEGSVAAAGVARESWETSAEYTVRVLHRLDLDPGAIGRLAALYREARFSGHPLGEEARTAAETALRRLHQDLGVAGTDR
jgi:hypothetical protein